MGVSAGKAKTGYGVVRKIQDTGYTGNAFSVNLLGGEMFGFHAFREIEEISDDTDIVSIFIPAKSIFPAGESLAYR